MAYIKREKTDSIFVLMPPVYAGSLHQRIRKIRNERKMSQNEVASLAGMTVQNLQRIEQGYTKHLPYETLEAICSALDYPISKIINASEDKAVSVA